MWRGLIATGSNVTGGREPASTPHRGNNMSIVAAVLAIEILAIICGSAMLVLNIVNLLHQEIRT